MTSIEITLPARRAGVGSRVAGGFLVPTIALLGAGGCGSSSDGFERVPVEGRVTLDGKDLPTGTISFIPRQEGGTASGPIADGRFRLSRGEGPSPGPYRVEIYSIQPTGKKGPSADDPNLIIDEVTNIIPRRYNFDSTLKADIPSGGPAEPLSFPLTSNATTKKLSRRER